MLAPAPRQSPTQVPRLRVQAGAAKALKEKNELLTKASGQLFKARELDREEQLPSLAYGQLALARARPTTRQTGLTVSLQS